MGDERTIFSYEDGKEMQRHRLEIHGIILPTGLQQLVRIVQMKHPNVEIRRQLMMMTSLCDVLPVTVLNEDY
jgi:hypothetical protein